jgi:hypothetical protein
MKDPEAPKAAAAADVTEALETQSLEPRTEGGVDPAGEIIGRVRTDDGAEVFGGRIVGPAVGGAGTVIAGSLDGPFTSIAEDRRIAARCCGPPEPVAEFPSPS